MGDSRSKFYEDEYDWEAFCTKKQLYNKPMFTP